MQVKFEDCTALGIDVGSLYIKTVGIDAQGCIISRNKFKNHGNQNQIISSIIEESNNHSMNIGIAADFYLSAYSERVYDPIQCTINAVLEFYPNTKNILEIGANHYHFISLDQKGKLIKIISNSPCASGTGLFLDSQAERMGIEYRKISEMNIVPDPPVIATHCAVFAKTDLIHRQQEGFSPEAMWSGLCQGFVENLLNTVSNNDLLDGQLVLCGGVALNRAVQYWFQEILKQRKADCTSHALVLADYATALGVAFHALQNKRNPTVNNQFVFTKKKRQRRPKLEFTKSKYPDAMTCKHKSDHDGNETNIHFIFDSSASQMSVFLGIDIGSISTKIAVIDKEGKLILDVYRRTEGDPIQATQKLFQKIINLCHEHHLVFRVKGTATTGSGRKLIGAIIGADLTINEISAHARGSLQIDHEVETIFEIGGQDSKLISLKDGKVTGARLNYVCAAGTGAFIEELASRLGYTIDEIGKQAMGVTPPYTSSRCTLFMEQDIHSLMQEGITQREAAGAVMYSICDNYLDRVVGLQPISQKRILFQGATARNRALAAAFENILGVEIVVPSQCHVMGAYGAALLVRQRMKYKSKFKGFDLGNKRIEITHENCTYCKTRCLLSHAVIEGEKEIPRWGMKCGRKGDQIQKYIPAEYLYFQKISDIMLQHDNVQDQDAKYYQNSIVIPRVFTTYTFFHFWQTFFRLLGFRVVLGPETDLYTIQRGNAAIHSDFCLPMKTAVGHLLGLLNSDDYQFVFMPHILADSKIAEVSNTRYCPYISVIPSLIKHKMKNHDNLIAPVIDFRLSDQKNAATITNAFSPLIRLNQKNMLQAFKQARQARLSVEKAGEKIGRKLLGKLEKPVLVIVGNPYVIFDKALCKGIPSYIAGCGYKVIPYHCLPFKPELLTGEFGNLYWSYGQHIISAVIQIMQTKGLYGVFLSNFGCGPNSLLLSYAENIMGSKPFLVLELDEHGSTGGYQTRVEAFLDVVKQDWTNKTIHSVDWTPPHEIASSDDLKNRTIWIPPMHTIGNRLFAATFRGQGCQACTLPKEDEMSFSLGKKWMRGSECLPTPLIFGTFLKQLEKERAKGESPEEKDALFMPTADGPCRFGQYRTLERILLDRMGYDRVPILSPGAHNGYYGLKSKLRLGLWKAIIVSDILFKMGCRIRPYEIHSGDTDQTLELWIGKAEDHIVHKRNRWTVFLKRAMNDFLNIPVKEQHCPLVGVVGEIYVRFNAFANDQLVKTIESMGGEVWISPISEWILYTIWNEYDRARRRGYAVGQILKLAVKWKVLAKIRSDLYRSVQPIIAHTKVPSTASIIQKGRQCVPVDFEGESLVTLGRAMIFKENGADLVINCSSFGCMHGNVTATLLDQMREKMGIPIINAVFDGLGQDRTLARLMVDIQARKSNRLVSASSMKRDFSGISL